MLDQQRMWEDTLADDSATEHQARHGAPVSTEIDTTMMHDIQVLVSRLVMKARQLIKNFTTNLVEGWMQIRSKFVGGKVVNRSQSGSWQTGAVVLGYSKTWEEAGDHPLGRK